MILYSYKTSEVYPRQILSYSQNMITLTIKTFKNRDIESNTKIIYFSELDKNKVYSLDYMINGYYEYLIDDEHEPNSEYAALKIYISNNGEVNIFSPINIEISETSEQINKVILTEKYFNFRALLSDKYPEYAEKVERMSYHDMIHDLIDPNYACACHDAQLEIITKLLLSIIENNPNLLSSSDSNNNIAHLINLLEETSLFNVKSEESIKKELENKKYIRNLQTQYYKLKSKR